MSAASALTTDRSMCPEDLTKGCAKDQVLPPKNAALLLRRDISLRAKCLDSGRPVTEVWSAEEAQSPQKSFNSDLFPILAARTTC